MSLEQNSLLVSPGDPLTGWTFLQMFLHACCIATRKFARRGTAFHHCPSTIAVIHRDAMNKWILSTWAFLFSDDEPASLPPLLLSLEYVHQIYFGPLLKLFLLFYEMRQRKSRHFQNHAGILAASRYFVSLIIFPVNLLFLPVPFPGVRR